MIPAEIFQQAVQTHLAPIRNLLDDASVSEILVNGPEEIYVERGGRLTRTGVRFASSDHLCAALRSIAQYVGRSLDEHQPILEGRLPDGSRVQALLPPVSPEGPTVAIRRFSRETLTVERLVESDSLSSDAASVLHALIVAKQNVIVAGGTGSGKTSLLNALSACIPPEERVVVIEDTRELQLQQSHTVQLETRPCDSRGKYGVTIRDLFRATLRLRPDRIVVGEIRGAEALDLIQAMTSGHGGCLSTVHATYPRDVLTRLETMALMSDVALPLTALRSQISAAIDIIVQTSRLSTGQRVVTHVTEVNALAEGNAYALRDLFVRESSRTRSGTGHARLVPTGVRPECEPCLEAQGYTLPEAVLARNREISPGARY